MRTIEIDKIVRKTFAYPDGCREQKIAYLYSLGITAHDIKNYETRGWQEPSYGVLYFRVQFLRDGEMYEYAAICPALGSNSKDRLWYTTTGRGARQPAPTECKWDVLNEWLIKYNAQDVQSANTWSAQPKA